MSKHPADWKIQQTDRMVRCLVLNSLFPEDQVRPSAGQVIEVAKMLGVSAMRIEKDLMNVRLARELIRGGADEWKRRDLKRKRMQLRRDVAAEITRRLVSDYQTRRARKGLNPYDLPPTKELISEIFFGLEPGQHEDPAENRTIPETDAWDSYDLPRDLGEPESELKSEWDE